MIYEYRFKFKDGSYHWMRDEMELVKDKNGNPIEAIGSVIEVTEEKETKIKGIRKKIQGAL